MSIFSVRNDYIGTDGNEDSRIYRNFWQLSLWKIVPTFYYGYLSQRWADDAVWWGKFSIKNHKLNFIKIDDADKQKICYFELRIKQQETDWVGLMKETHWKRNHNTSDLIQQIGGPIVSAKWDILQVLIFL